MTDDLHGQVDQSVPSGFRKVSDLRFAIPSAYELSEVKFPWFAGFKALLFLTPCKRL